MPRTKNVTLGGISYEVTQLPMQANKEFRNSLAEPVRQVLAMLESNRSITLDTVSDLAQVLTLVNDVLLSCVDILLDALFRYSPVLAEDRQRIEYEAYDDEAIDALGVVVSLAYPLGRLATIWRGPSVTATLPNSPSTSGSNGTKTPIKASQKST